MASPVTTLLQGHAMHTVLFTSVHVPFSFALGKATAALSKLWRGQLCHTVLPTTIFEYVHCLTVDARLTCGTSLPQRTSGPNFGIGRISLQGMNAELLVPRALM